MLRALGFSSGERGSLGFKASAGFQIANIPSIDDQNCGAPDFKIFNINSFKQIALMSSIGSSNFRCEDRKQVQNLFEVLLPYEVGRS